MLQRRINFTRNMLRWRREHGKHLLIEKPMALTLEECAAIIDAAGVPACIWSSGTAIRSTRQCSVCAR